LFIVNYVNFYVNVHCEIPMFLCGRFHRSSCPISSSLCPLGWGLEVCGPGDANQQHILFIWGEFVLGTRSRMCYKLQFSACLSRIHPGALVQVQFFLYTYRLFFITAPLQPQISSQMAECACVHHRITQFLWWIYPHGGSWLPLSGDQLAPRFWVSICPLYALLWIVGKNQQVGRPELAPLPGYLYSHQMELPRVGKHTGYVLEGALSPLVSVPVGLWVLGPWQFLVGVHSHLKCAPANGAIHYRGSHRGYGGLPSSC